MYFNIIQVFNYYLIYQKSDNLDEKVTQTLQTSSFAKAVTLTSPAMAAVYEETSPDISGRTDGMQQHESVTTKTLFTKHSGNHLLE